MVAAGSKLAPATVNVKALPPARAELGVNSAMAGALAAGVGGGAGSGVAGGVAVDTGLTKFPPTRNTLPLSVLKAKPFWPQRISRRAFPLTFGIVIEPTSVKWVISKACKVTLAGPDGWVRTNTRFKAESGTVEPAAARTPTADPLVGSTTCPFSAHTR